jgi:hypothetical protein
MTSAILDSSPCRVVSTRDLRYLCLGLSSLGPVVEGHQDVFHSMLHGFFKFGSHGAYRGPHFLLALPDRCLRFYLIFIYLSFLFFFSGLCPGLANIGPGDGSFPLIQTYLSFGLFIYSLLSNQIK